MGHWSGTRFQAGRQRGVSLAAPARALKRSRLSVAKFQWRQNLGYLVRPLDVGRPIGYSIASAHRTGGDEGVFRLLASSDECEIGLHRLAAVIFEDPTHDSVAARIIQGSAPPGAKVDIAPTWLVSDASNHSRSVAKRQQQVNSLRSRKGDKGSKGSAKGAKRADCA